MLNIVLLGPPGSGKGTQAELLAKKFLLQHISTGELLRKAMLLGTELGLQAKSLINMGRLVSDDIIINLLQESLKLSATSNYQGIILDGFPRNILQAHTLEVSLVVDIIIYLKVSDHEIINRLAGRRYHPNSGRIYHVEYNPPKIPGIDDVTGEPLIIRADDQPDIIQERLLVYHQATELLIDWYKSRHAEKFIEVDAASEQIKIFHRIVDSIAMFKTA